MQQTSAKEIQNYVWLDGKGDPMVIVQGIKI